MERLIETQLKSYGCTVAADVWTAQTPAGPKSDEEHPCEDSGDGGASGGYEQAAITIRRPMPGITFVGANDGGSSAGILLELARVLCGKQGADSVWLVWLDGEEAVRHDWSSEDSLYGSKRLASKWSADGTAGKVKALINVDMIGDRELNILEDMNSSTQLRQIVWAAARELNYGQYFTGLQSAIEDDHIPFARAGIPSLDIIDFDYGPNNSYWHTDRDTVDKLSAHSFQVVGEVLLRTLSKLGDMQ